jgi:membrane-bound metal-dependent hydrolase YbcI (DUF457 family)
VEGTTHASTGVLLGAGVALLLHAGAGHGVPAWHGAATDVLFGLVTGGFALLPDADHPKASFARAAGPLSHGISHLVAVLTGGHRKGMHSLPGVAVIALLVQFCAVWHPTHWTLGILAGLMAICIAAGLGATGFARHGLTALLWGGIVAGLAVHFIRADLWWLAALGMALHIIEDMFTGHGVALLWPLTRRRFGGTQKKAVARTSRARRRPAPRQGRTRPETPPVRTTRPPKTRTAPWKPDVRMWQSMCAECIEGDHAGCTDKDCQCEPRDVVHPNRPSKTVRVRPEPSADPPF